MAIGADSRVLRPRGGRLAARRDGGERTRRRERESEREREKEIEKEKEGRVRLICNKRKRIGDQ